MKINKRLNTNKKRAIVAVALALGVVILYLIVASIKHLPPFMSEAETFQPGEQIINMERTDTEKLQTQAIKDNPDLKTQNNQTDTPSAPNETMPSGKQSVNVLLTNAGIIDGNVRVSGMVTNIVEEGGRCTYVFTNGLSSVTRTSKTLTNPTSTTCEAAVFPSSELPANGSWKVVINYSSDKYEGKSNEKEFTK